MAHWILKSNGYVVPRRTLHPLNVDKLHSLDEQKKWNSGVVSRESVCITFIYAALNGI